MDCQANYKHHPGADRAGGIAVRVTELSGQAYQCHLCKACISKLRAKGAGVVTQAEMGITPSQAGKTP